MDANFVLFLLNKTLENWNISFFSVFSALPSVVALGGTPTRGQHSPTGGLRHQGSQPLPSSGVWVETSGFIAFGQLRIASPATICRICNG